MGGLGLGTLLTTFFTSSAGEAVGTGIASAAVGEGLNKILSPKMPNITIPPPPGAAMIDPAGSQAAAQTRARQAAAGGISSTITGAGQVASQGPTSGAKQLLGA